MSNSNFVEPDLYGGYCNRKSQETFQGCDPASVGYLTQREKKKVSRIFIHREVIDNRSLTGFIT